jgi:uncharacterized cupredoxin-like copper-binding protein
MAHELQAGTPRGRKAPIRRGAGAGPLLTLLAALLPTGLAGCRVAPAPPYQPRTRQVTITTIPLLTRELQKVYPFLKADFAPGGVLDGKEVYAFLPGTVTVVEGDTIQFRLVNPEDDLHSFVLPPDLSVALPGQQTANATWIARQAGIFTFTCSIPAHLPEMWGEVVVLSPAALGMAAGPARPAPTGGAR